MNSSQRQVNFNLDRSSSVPQTPSNGNVHRLTFVDFSPQSHSSYVKSLFSKTETYGDLINRVNEWLEEHVEFQAKTVESVLFEPVSCLNKSVVHGSNVEQQRKLFSCRVWLCPKNGENALQPVQRIKVLNIIPKVKITGREHDLFMEQKSGKRLSYSSLELPTFESIDELVPSLNQLLQANKYFGQILNIETVALPIRLNKWTVDTEDLEFPATNVKGVLNILRVYFNERLFMNETVEILNFIPERETQWNAPMAVPNLENFTNVLKRASQTLRQRTDQLRLLSCSTICCPTNALSGQTEGNFIDANKTFYSNAEWQNSGSFLAKFIRIAIARTVDSSGFSSNSILLNCKIFVPVKKNANEPSSPDHEMQMLKDAVQSWFSKTEAKVLSVETEIISSAITWTSSTTLIDTCLSLNKYPCDQLIVFKVYIDGHYIEPSKESKLLKVNK